MAFVEFMGGLEDTRGTVLWMQRPWKYNTTGSVLKMAVHSVTC